MSDIITVQPKISSTPLPPPDHSLASDGKP
jgi:hypothetical protein